RTAARMVSVGSSTSQDTFATRRETMMNTMLAAQAQSYDMQLLGVGLFVVLGVGLLAYAVLFIGASISIVLSEHGGGMKLAWIVFAFVAPFIGSLLWFLIGRRDARRNDAAAVSARTAE